MSSLRTFWPDAPMLGVDLETTGVDALNDCPVAWALVYFMGYNVVDTERGLIQPDRPIPVEATEIHGISDVMCEAKGTPMDHTVSLILTALMRATEIGMPIVGMNVSFDLTMLDAMSRKYLYVPAPSLCPVIDLMVLDRQVEPYREGSRSLTETAPHYGVDRGPRHHPVSDAIAAVRTVHAMCQKHPSIGYTDPRELHRLQVMWRREQMQSRSRKLVSHGEEPVPPHEYNWPFYSRRTTPADVVPIRRDIL